MKTSELLQAIAGGSYSDVKRDGLWPEDILEALEDVEPKEHRQTLAQLHPFTLDTAKDWGWQALTGYEPEWIEPEDNAHVRNCLMLDKADAFQAYREGKKAEHDREVAQIWAMRRLIGLYATMGTQHRVDLFEAVYSPYMKRDVITMETVVSLPGQEPKRYIFPDEHLADWEALTKVSIDSNYFKRHWNRMVKNAEANPFEDYLRGLPEMGLDEALKVKATAIAQVFGKDQSDEAYGLDTELFWHWLTSIVARTFEPGCENRGALVLYSKNGGAGKSTFFKTMALGKTVKTTAHSPYYASFGPDDNEFVQVEGRLRVIREIEEIEATKKDMKELRRLLTSAEFSLNRKGQQPIQVKDRGVWGISTNKRDIFTDDNTTRFYVIQVGEYQHSINNVWLEQSGVDFLYRAALALYRHRLSQGEYKFWELSGTLAEANKARNGHHMITSNYVDKVQDILVENAEDGYELAFNLNDLYEAVGVSLKDKTAIADIRRYLEQMGYDLVSDQRLKVGDKRRRMVWPKGATALKVLGLEFGSLKEVSKMAPKG